jgi:hypothetical protein
MKYNYVTLREAAQGASRLSNQLTHNTGDTENMGMRSSSEASSSSAVQEIGRLA